MCRRKCGTASFLAAAAAQIEGLLGRERDEGFHSAQLSVGQHTPSRPLLCLQTDLADGALQLNDTLLAAVGADYAASSDLQVWAASSRAHVPCSRRSYWLQPAHRTALRAPVTRHVASTSRFLQKPCPQP